MGNFLLWTTELARQDELLVGNDIYDLSLIAQANIITPKSFIILPKTFDHFLNENGIRRKICNYLLSINFDDRGSIEYTSKKIQQLIQSGSFSENVTTELFSALKQIAGIWFSKPFIVQVRPVIDLSIYNVHAVQQNMPYQISGEANLLLEIKRIWETLFSTHALIYLNQYKQLRKSISATIIIQESIVGKLSGLLTTTDIQDKTLIPITAVYGWHSILHSHPLVSDEYVVKKYSGLVVSKTIRTQTLQIMNRDTKEKNTRVSPKISAVQKLTQSQIKQLAVLAESIEKIIYFPKELVWTYDKNRFIILQIREIPSQLPLDTLRKTYAGYPLFPGIRTGVVKIVRSVQDLANIQFGDIIISNLPLEKLQTVKAGGIILENTQTIPIEAINTQISGIPIISHVTNALLLFQEDSIITINGTNGTIINGASLTFNSNESIPQSTATKLMLLVNMTKPSTITTQKQLISYVFIRSDDLLTSLTTHPKNIINEQKTEEIKKKYRTGLNLIAETFSSIPILFQTTHITSKDVHVSASGAYNHSNHACHIEIHGIPRSLVEWQFFETELAAIADTLHQHTFQPIALMIPHITHSSQLINIQKLLHKHTLSRSSTFQIWMQLDTPAQVINLDTLVNTGFDGVGIDLDSLTAHLLSIDTSNTRLKDAYQQCDPALIWALEKIITVSQSHGIKSMVYSNISLPNEILHLLIRSGISYLVTDDNHLYSLNETLVHLEQQIFLSSG